MSRHPPAVTVQLVPDEAWIWAQSLFAGVVSMVVADWLWSLAWTWPEQEPAIWLAHSRWVWIVASAGVVFSQVWRRVRCRPGPGHRLAGSGEGDWQWDSPGDGTSPCAVRVALDLGDWLLLRIDLQGDPSRPDAESMWPTRRRWVALSRRHHPDRWHDLRLALVSNAD